MKRFQNVWVRLEYVLLMALLFVLVLVTLAVPNAFAGNASQDTLDKISCSGTIAVTNTWQQVLKRDPARKRYLVMNVGSNAMGMFMPPYANNNATPTATGIGSPDVWTLAATNGSYEPDGGWLPGGEVWMLGTAGDSFSCEYMTSASP